MIYKTFGLIPDLRKKVLLDLVTLLQGRTHQGHDPRNSAVGLLRQGPPHTCWPNNQGCPMGSEASVGVCKGGLTIKQMGIEWKSLCWLMMVMLRLGTL